MCRWKIRFGGNWYEFNFGNGKFKGIYLGLLGGSWVSLGLERGLSCEEDLELFSCAWMEFFECLDCWSVRGVRRDWGRVFSFGKLRLGRRGFKGVVEE